MDTYLLKFSACLLVFWLVYILVLERQKMHLVKRFYLLVAFVVSLTIPFLTITEYIEPITSTLETSTVYFPIEMSEEMPIEESPLITLENILWIVYGLGVLAFGLRFIINIVKLYRRVIKNERFRQRSFIYVLLMDYQIPHSFFRYIFLNKLRFNDNAIPKEVLVHEEAHAKQLHSLDIVIIEFLQILFWFHPLIYILKHHIKLNHEFMADQAVLKQGSDTKTYQNILLQFSSSGTHHYPNALGMTSAINYSSIKKRFTVMKTQTSKTRVWLSTFLLLPIVAILFYSFAEREYVEKETNEDQLFLVTVERQGDAINLKCKSGCRWSDITLEPKSEPYIINDFGFSEGQTLDTDKFAFSVQHNSSGIILNGLKGTAWTDLSFSLQENKKQAINQLGMTNSINHSDIDEKIKKVTIIKAINNQLFIDDKKSSLKSYVNDFNEMTKNWSSSDFEQTVLELETENCTKEFLDKLNELHKKTDHFLITVIGSKSQQNRSSSNYSLNQKNTIEDYLKKYKEYEKLRSTEPHYIHRSTNEQQKMDNLFSDLGGMYFRMSKKDKAKVERPISPIRPYVQITLKGKTYYKKSSELTKEERVTLPPPPPPPPAQQNASPDEKKKMQKVIDDYEKTYKRQVHTDKIDETGETINVIANDEVYNPEILQQKEATKKQVNAYNVWAKKMTKAIKESGLGEYKGDEYPFFDMDEYLKYSKIYRRLMTPEQRKSAQPFPKLLPPPPPPPPPAPEVPNKSKKGENDIPPPPPPPESPLDFVIRMAKKDAKFFSEGQSISSDEAIALLKKNNKLNINAKEKSENGKPLVYITKKPITINSKVGDKQNEASLIVNGHQISSPKIKMTITELKKLKLTLTEGKITSFKFKIPGLKTELIKGNSITVTTLKNLESAKTGDYITIFDIKYNDNSKLPPLVIEVVE